MKPEWHSRSIHTAFFTFLMVLQQERFLPYGLEISDVEEGTIKFSIDIFWHDENFAIVFDQSGTVMDIEPDKMKKSDEKYQKLISTVVQSLSECNNIFGLVPMCIREIGRQYAVPSDLRLVFFAHFMFEDDKDCIFEKSHTELLSLSRGDSDD